MRLRWPLMRKAAHETIIDALLARQNARLGEKERMIAAKDRLNGNLTDLLHARERVIDGLREQYDLAMDTRRVFVKRSAELARDVADLRAELARPLPCPAVAPFWLGLPNHLLNLVVTTNMDGIQATLESTPRDDASDDPRRNPTLAFALKPL